MAEIVDQLRLDITQALRDIDRIESNLDRALAPIEIEIEVDDRSAQELESTLREVERIAGRAATEVGSIDLAAGRAETNFEDLARAMGITEERARDVTRELLESQAAANRLEDAARDVARQLGLSDTVANRLAGSLREADRAADRINVASGGLVGAFGKVRTAALGIGGAIAGAVIAGGAALAALAMGANKAIQGYAELEDSINAVKVVFGEGSAAVLRFSEDAAQSAGLSERAFNQAVAPIGAVLTNFGFSAGEASEAAVILAQRGADLASVYGGTVQENINKITSALVGQVEPLRTVGAEISQTRVEAFALATGLLQAGQEMDTATAVQARYGLILKDTAAVQNDFANTAGDLANAQRSAAAATQNFADDVGEQLAPALEALVGIVPELIEGLRLLIPSFGAAGDSAAGFFAEIEKGGNLRTIVSGIAGAAGLVGDAYLGLGDIGQGAFALLQGDLSGVAAQFEQLGDRAQNTAVRLNRLQLAQALDKGTNATKAFADSILRLGRATEDVDEFQQEFRGLAAAAGLTLPQLRKVTLEMLESGAASKLSADELAVFRDQAALLTNALDPNIEAIRQFNFESRNAAAEAGFFSGALTTLTGEGGLAAISLSNIADSVANIPSAITDVLEAVGPLPTTLQQVADGTITAADAFRDTLVPSLIDVTDALIDFNDNGKVSLDEFILGLEETRVATANYRDNMVAILKESPETFEALLDVPLPQRIELVEEAVSTGRIAELELVVVTTADEIETEFRTRVAEAVAIYKSQGPEAAEQFALGVPELFDAPELKTQIVEQVNAATTAADGEIDRLVESVLTQTEAADRAGETTTSVYDASLTRRLKEADLANNPYIAGLIEEGLSQIDAADTGATETTERYITTLNRTLDEGLAGIDFEGKGVESITAYYRGLTHVPPGTVGGLNAAITSVLDGAIIRSSPPKLFVDAGVDSGEAFWMGFQQADMQLKVPTPSFTGTVTNGKELATGTSGGDFNFSPTYVNTETKDLETVVARSEQLMSSVAGILNGRFKL